MNKKSFASYSAKYHENCCLRVRPRCVQIYGRTEGEILTGLTCRCERLKKEVKARLHGSPRFINAVESTKLNSKFERYCLHSSTKVNEAVDFKMAANELVRAGVVVICDYLMKECQHI